MSLARCLLPGWRPTSSLLCRTRLSWEVFLEGTWWDLRQTGLFGGGSWGARGLAVPAQASRSAPTRSGIQHSASSRLLPAQGPRGPGPILGNVGWEPGALGSEAPQAQHPGPLQGFGARPSPPRCPGHPDPLRPPVLCGAGTRGGPTRRGRARVQAEPALGTGRRAQARGPAAETAPARPGPWGERGTQGAGEGRCGLRGKQNREGRMGWRQRGPPSPQVRTQRSGNPCLLGAGGRPRQRPCPGTKTLPTLLLGDGGALIPRVPDPSTLSCARVRFGVPPPDHEEKIANVYFVIQRYSITLTFKPFVTLETLAAVFALGSVTWSERWPAQTVAAADCW